MLLQERGISALNTVTRGKLFAYGVKWYSDKKSFVGYILQHYNGETFAPLPLISLCFLHILGIGKYHLFLQCYRSLNYFLMGKK
jgi:hypothetical protein